MNLTEKLAKSAVLGIALGVSIFILWQFSSLRIAPLEEYGQLPAFRAQAANSDKPTIINTDLTGKPWIADFIFTYCGGPCPVLSSNFARLQEILPPEVSLVSFTVDPDHDTPEILEDYARRFGAQKNRWIFLRLKKQELYDLLYAGFHEAIAENNDAPPEERVTHSARMVLVDAEGKIRGYYDGLDGFSAERILKDIKRLNKEKNNV